MIAWPKARGVALQAAGLERDKGRFGARAGGFCAKSALVAPEAGGLERDTTRLGSRNHVIPLLFV